MVDAAAQRLPGLLEIEREQGFFQGDGLGLFAGGRAPTADDRAGIDVVDPRREEAPDPVAEACISASKSLFERMSRRSVSQGWVDQFHPTTPGMWPSSYE